MSLQNLVLIETLWNVKREKYLIYETESYGINRNIVECKAIICFFIL